MQQEPKSQRERAKDLISLLVPDWRPTPRQGLWAIRIGIVLGLLVAIGYSYGVTLWDWLKLLIVPAVIAAGGFWFNRQQQERELEIENQRAQGQALQAYLDQMSQLLNDQARPLREAREQQYNDAPLLARARTLTVLSGLDVDRKRSVLEFLYESGLISATGAVLNLRGADLTSVHLHNCSLRGANLSGTNLREANLSEADLGEVDLTGADLQDANLTKAILFNAKLNSLLQLDHLPTSVFQIQRVGLPEVNTDWDRPANLIGANLSEANLYGADLSDAYLAGAKFDGAKLLDAKLVRSCLGGSRHEYWDYAELGRWKENMRFFYALMADQNSNQETPDTNIVESVIGKPPSFSGANLSRTDLSEAAAGSPQMKELLKAKLEGATMPNGQKYEDWLKDRGGRGEDG